MNIGTICYATPSGLGHLAKMFYDNGIVSRILIIEHGNYPMFTEEWYPQNVRFNPRNSKEQKQFLDGLDIILVFESLMGHKSLIEDAKKRGIKFAIIPMYEWTPHKIPVTPDLVICPSDIDTDCFTHYPNIRLNIPAPNEVDVPWRQRTHAIEFVHNAGHGQAGFAKGTPETLEAFNHTRSDAKLLVRYQHGRPDLGELVQRYKGHPKITIEAGDKSYSELFNTGDVYINAERYNGLSLPLQEACSAGMLVMTTDRYPTNTWLPDGPLFPPEYYERHTVTNEIDRAKVDPKTIANYIDTWYGKDIFDYSVYGLEWRQKNSWQALKPKYMEAFDDLIKKR